MHGQRVQRSNGQLASDPLSEGLAKERVPGSKMPERTSGNVFHDTMAFVMNGTSGWRVREFLPV